MMVSRYFVDQQSSVTWKLKTCTNKETLEIVQQTQIAMETIFAKNGDETNVQDLSTFLNELEAEGSIGTFKKATFEGALVHQIHCWLKDVDWKFDFGEFAMVYTTLCTLSCSAQAGHKDYPAEKEVEKGSRWSFIHPLSKNGCFLIVWQEDNPTKPLILHLPADFCKGFDEDFLHAGGIGLAKDAKEVMQNINVGCPRGHLYVTCRADLLPSNFICYADPNHSNEPYYERYELPSPEVCLTSCQDYNTGHTMRNKRKGTRKDFPTPIDKKKNK